MKIKQKPEDFQVEELTDVAPRERGPFALYRLEKRGWATPDAIQAIRRRWQVDLRHVSYGGLKDRHAQTVQYLTILHGPQKGLQHHEVKLQYLGQVAEPYSSRHIRANRFQLTLRRLTLDEVARADQILAEIRVDGLPNYFDDQRFGSVGGGERFVARLMVLGRHEEALRLALTAPYSHDRSPQKQEKASLLQHWGDWATCKTALHRSHARSLVDYLVSHPSDFRGALARLRPDLRGLYLSAYQSYLWNRMLARWILEQCRAEQILSVPLRLGEFPMHHQLNSDQRTLFLRTTLPLPSSRIRLEPGDPRRSVIETVMAEEGISLDELKLRGFREMFFSKGERAVLCLPAGLEHEAGPDERHPCKQRLDLRFDLQRGSYATLIVKRIQAASVGPLDEPDATD
jgi:tRNA pseudouridine13 synthase